MGADLIIFIATSAFNSMGLSPTDTLDLGMLVGSPANHPAALAHNDNVVDKGASPLANQTLIDEMLADIVPTSSPYLTVSSLTRSHARRIAESEAAGYPAPSASQLAFELGEISLYPLVLGQDPPTGSLLGAVGRVFPKSWAEDWFMMNRIPDEWVRNPVPPTLVQGLALNTLIETDAQADS
jgi:hypothetical protein